MSTVLRPSGSRRATSRISTAARHAGPGSAVGFALALGLGVFTFVTGGGTDLGSNTWAEIAVMLVAAGLAIAAVLVSAPGKWWGSGALLLFAALAALTAASITWSVQPADSWVEAGRTASYLAAFGGAMALARIAPGRWAAVIGAVAVVATVVSGYALLAKVFPASLDAGDRVGRLRLPFDYWNAVGLMAAIGIPACLWSGARHEGSLLTRALAPPALGVLGVAVMLSVSRGALAVVVIGLVLWFALVSFRLRAAAVLLLALAGVAAVSAWALANNSIVNDNVVEHARTVAGHQLGVLLLVMVVALSAAGLALAVALDRVKLTERTRRRIGISLVVLVALVPLAAIGKLAASSRGPTGEISHLWDELTSSKTNGTTDLPGRLVQLSSTRGRYWHEALKVGDHALLGGEGAGGFSTAATHYTPTTIYAAVDHAHGYLFETFADLGLIGVALSVMLLVAWLSAARRTLGVRRPPDAHVAERAGLSTLFAIVIMFGLSSTVDWTWFVPGPTLVAMICAGWVAGRGPLAQPSRPAARAEPGGPGPLAEPSGRARAARTPLAIASITAIALAALVIAWMVYQPLRSADADAAGLTASNGAAAIADAKAAAAYDPVSVDPLFELAALYQSVGDEQAALAEYRKATALQPDNPQTWLYEGQFLLQRGRARQALGILDRALALNRDNATVDIAVSAAQTALLRR